MLGTVGPRRAVVPRARGSYETGTVRSVSACHLRSDEADRTSFGMQNQSTRAWPPAVVGLLLTSGFALRANAETDVDDNNFRQDVILCEEAVKHVMDCCGYSVQADACRHYRSVTVHDCGCMSSGDGRTEVDVWPVLSVHESTKIANASCAAMTEVAGDGTDFCTRIRPTLEAENHRQTGWASDCR